MIKMIAIKSGSQQDISNIVTDLSWSGNISACTRTLTFNLLVGFDLPLSSQVVLYLNNNEVFRGYVADRKLSNPSSVYNYTAYDIGEKLNKIKVNYNFKDDITVSGAVSKVLSENGFPVGQLASADTKVKRIFMNTTVYEVINTLYSLHGAIVEKPYCITSTNGAINVLEKGVNMSNTVLEEGTNVISSDIQESLTSLINKVLIVDENGNQLDTIDNSSSISTHGTYQEIYEKKEEDPDYMDNAKDLLENESIVINVSGYGDIDHIANNKVEVIDRTIGIKGTYYIESDDHTIELTKHTVKMKLLLENIMKISNAGQEGGTE